MKNSEISNDITVLFNKYKIGNIIGEPKSISCGLMHKMFKVKTETNIYAVKWLNPAVMQRNGGMLGWLEYSLKRALGIESADEEEKALGAEQAVGTIKELERYNNQIKTLKEWLSE